MYHSILKNEHTDELMEAVLSLKDKEDCYRFFEDLCTINEIHSMALRFKIALLLDEGKTYEEIEKLTKASAATISRINRCLHYGASGYKNVLKRKESKLKDE